MTDIDDAIDDVRDAAVDLLNSEGRSAAHVAMGVALTVEHLSVPGYVEDLSLNLRPGEILGMAGLVGSGRTEAAEAMPGAVDGHRAVVAVVTHRADRTEATIVAEKSVLTFMVVAPASKQMHGAIPW